MGEAYWMKWWALALGSVLTFALIVAVGTNFAGRRSDAAIVEMVKAGSDPIAAACALERMWAENCVKLLGRRQ